jgi:hypothetical protein
MPAASDDQQRRLAVALRLDFSKDGKTALWPTLLSQRILANAVPGLTPLKRKAPDPHLDGLIRVPGAAAPPPPADGAPKRHRCTTAGKASKASHPASDAGKSDSDASASAVDESVLVSDDEMSAPPVLMPAELGTGLAFSDLVKTICARRWVPSRSFEAGLPAVHSKSLWRARLWSTKDRAAYDKMITNQAISRNRTDRREDPNSVACPHRLTFA